MFLDKHDNQQLKSIFSFRFRYFDEENRDIINVGKALCTWSTLFSLFLTLHCKTYGYALTTLITLLAVSFLIPVSLVVGIAERIIAVLITPLRARTGAATLTFTAIGGRARSFGSFSSTKQRETKNLSKTQSNSVESLLKVPSQQGQK